MPFSDNFSGNAPPASATTPTNGGTTMPTSPTTVNVGASQQAPNFLGQGIYVANPYAINDNAITGQPTQGASQNYGLNDVYNSIQNAYNNVGNIGGNMMNAATGAPISTVNGVTGTAAQGNAAIGNAATGNASLGNQSWTTAANGQASAAQLAQVQAAQAQAAQAQAAQMQAAQGGYSQANGATIATGQDNALLGQQQQNVNQLNGIINGTAPSVAATQLNQGEQQQVANQLAVLGSQRGAANFALGQRQAQEQTAAAQQNLAANQQLARQQEVNTAENTVGNVLGTARGQTQNMVTSQAGLTQGANQYNATNAQQAALQNAQFQQQAGTTNVSNAQQTALQNQQAQNNMILAKSF